MKQANLFQKIFVITFIIFVLILFIYFTYQDLKTGKINLIDIR